MEVRMSFRQFFTWKYPLSSLFRTTAILGSSILRLLLGRSLKYSFSFAGEDRIIEALLKAKITEPGFYVDVGCNHPKFLSNTYGLYRKGWRGICIDANSNLIRRYPFYRPKDKAVAALISDSKETRDFYYVENDVLSTTELAFVEEYKKDGLAITAKKMVSQTLTEALDDLQAPKKFELLSIDAEEHDLQVLRSLDFNAYQPRLIVVEDETYNPSYPERNAIYSLLAERGYFLEGYLLKNLYFLRQVQ